MRAASDLDVRASAHVPQPRCIFPSFSSCELHDVLVFYHYLLQQCAAAGESELRSGSQLMDG